MGTSVEFPSNGGADQGWLAVPASGKGPGMIVIQEWWGLVPHIMDICERFAREGFVALAPDLYHGKTTKEPDEAGKLLMAMRLEQASKDMAGAVHYLQQHPAVTGQGLGVIGFCMGGGLALMLAVQQPQAIRACVSYYGFVPQEAGQPDWSRVQGAVQGHYAENDSWAGAKVANELERDLQAVGKETQFFLYPNTEHAFFNDDRPEVYNRPAAEQAWERTLAFLHEKLG